MATVQDKLPPIVQAWLTVKVNPVIPTFDEQMTYLLPLSQRSSFTNEDLICKPTQVQGNQSSEYPVLRARAGDHIALRYRENGHITKQEPDKLTFGSVSVYGTNISQTTDTLPRIHHVWNANHTGGDMKGSLLHRQSFDDGSCYEKNDSELAIMRSVAGQPPHDAIDGASLTCKVVVMIPKAVQSKTTYTLYWVWDWPSIIDTEGAAGVRKEQVYTTCVDIQIE